MEKNSAPKFPARALSRLMCPMSLGSVLPISKPSSRKRCGVSACVSTTIAESLMAFALAETGLSWARASVLKRHARMANRNRKIFMRCVECTGDCIWPTYLCHPERNMPVSEANRHAQSRDLVVRLHDPPACQGVLTKIVGRYPEPDRAKDLAWSGTTPASRQIPRAARDDVRLHKRFHRRLDAARNWRLHIYQRLRQRDLLKPTLHPQIQSKIPVRRRMLLLLDPPPRRLFGTNALQNPPRLPQAVGIFDDTLHLVLPRKRTPIQNHNPRRIFPQQISSGLEHHFHAKIILLSRELNVCGSKQRAPDLVFIQHSSMHTRRQCSRKRTFPRAGKSRHHDNHWFCGENLLRIAGEIFNDVGIVFLRTLARQHARFAPVCIAVRDRDVEHPLAPLFFGLDQAHVFHRQHILFNPFHLLTGHA